MRSDTHTHTRCVAVKDFSSFGPAACLVLSCPALIDGGDPLTHSHHQLSERSNTLGMGTSVCVCVIDVGRTCDENVSSMVVAH